MAKKRGLLFTGCLTGVLSLVTLAVSFTSLWLNRVTSQSHAIKIYSHPFFRYCLELPRKQQLSYFITGFALGLIAYILIAKAIHSKNQN